MMEKCKRSHTDPFMAVLEMCNTPTQDAGSSPSQRLVNRRTRTVLSITHNLLGPRGELEHERDKLKVKHNQTMHATFNNRRAKDVPVLKEGARVRLKPFRLGQKGWNQGTVVARLDERSYDIETPDRIYRRNRVHIRKDTVPEEAVPMHKGPRFIDKTLSRWHLKRCQRLTIVRVKTSSYANRFERPTLRNTWLNMFSRINDMSRT